MKFFKKRKMSKARKKQLSIFMNKALKFELGVFFGVFLILGSFTNHLPYSTFDFISNSLNTARYDAVVYSNYDDNITIEISDMCAMFEEAKEQITCMQEQIEFFYNYTDGSNHTLNTPDEYYEKGGVCRDIAILQKSILLKMGWKVSYRYPIPRHVSISAYHLVRCDNEEPCHTYCDIDGLTYTCY